MNNSIYPYGIPLEELKKHKYGRMTIIDDAEPKMTENSVIRYVMCKCDCGAEKKIRLNGLRTGQTKSCGCLQKEKARKTGKTLKEYRTTHGLTNHNLFSKWHSIKTRCLNSNSRCFPNYGGRGIKICAEWESDFGNFYNWAINNGYREGLTIDRIDNDGNYEPSNCRWVTMKENERNRGNLKLSMIDAINIRNAHLLNCFTQREIAEGYGVGIATISNIINNKVWVD